MQHLGVALPQRAADDAVRPQGQALRRDVVRPVDLGDLFVGRVLDAVDAAAAQHLHDQAVQVFRAGPDDDLLRSSLDVAGSGQVAGQGGAQETCAEVRAALQHFFPVLAQHAAGRFRVDAEGKARLVRIRFRPVRSGHIFDRFHRKRAGFVVGDEVAAALLRGHVAFALQQLQRMLRRDDGNAEIPCDGALRREFCAGSIQTFFDVCAQASVEMQILFFLLFYCHLVFLFRQIGYIK